MLSLHSNFLTFCLPLLGAVALLSGGISTASADQKLADFKRVVVAQNALPVTQHAARELATYVEKITGSELEVVDWSDGIHSAQGLSFFVGQQTADKAMGKPQGPFKREEWMIKTISNGMVLAGDDQPGRATSTNVASGSQLAVYTLLDDYLGVRWLWPGEAGEHVPSDVNAKLPSLDLRDQPRFIIRNYSIGYTRYHTKQFREDSALWSRRSRLGWAPAATFGHSWFYAFNLRGPIEKNPDFLQHPEWFALGNGVRRPPQMCTTHPEVIDRMVEYVLADTKRAITTISPSDGGGFCQCDEETKSDLHKKLGIPSCTSLDPPAQEGDNPAFPKLSNRIFTYANEIARRVREKDPNKGVGMFAYTYYNKPPTNIDKLESNLYLSFVFQAQAHLDPAAHEEWLESIAGWQKLGATMVVREGWGNHYLLDLPFIYDKQIHSSLQTAANLGFIAAYGEGSKSFATQMPNTWSVVRTLWNPQINYQDMMSDYYTKAYGPAASAMRAYFETYSSSLEKNWADRRFILDTRFVAYLNLVNSWQIILPATVVDEAEKHLVAAEKIAGSEGEYAGRIKLHRIGQTYTRCMLELIDAYRQLAELGMDMEFLSKGVTEVRYDPALRAKLLKRAYELGEQREDILLANRDLPGPDEGLYAITNDREMRQWHSNVKQLLGIETPTRITREQLEALDQKTKAEAEADAADISQKEASMKSKVVSAAPPAPAAVAGNNLTDQLTRATPLWKLPENVAKRTGEPVLIIGEGYGRHEMKALKQEVLDFLYTRVKFSETFVSAKTWSAHQMVIIADMTDGLASQEEQAAVVDFLRQGGRLMLLGTAMRTFDNATPELIQLIGGHGYRSKSDGKIQVNTQHPDNLLAGDENQKKALGQIFGSAYTATSITGDAAVLASVDGSPAAFISQAGEGRVLFIGKELFRVRIEEKREKKEFGGDALRNWLRKLIHEIAPVDMTPKK